MRFRLNHMKVGPFRINLSTKTGVSSVSLPVAGTSWRLWSRDGSRGLTSIDTPGQGSIRMQPKTRRQRERAEAAEAKARADVETAEQTILDEYPPLSFDPRKA